MQSSMSASVGLGFSLQQDGRGHDLPRLAVAALGHVLGDPGLLERPAEVVGEPLDRGDLLARRAATPA